MKVSFRLIPVVMVVLLLITGCFNPFAKKDKGEFVMDEQGNVHFVKGDRKAETEEEITMEEAVEKEDVIVISTNKGEIVFKFFPEDAPKTVENFKKLTQDGYYNDLTFHRVEEGFVIQGGDPKGNGTGGPGYTIEDEFNARPHLEGTVAMARTPAPNSAGSQFYICLSSLPQLDGKYTVFGQVVDGLEVVHQIEKGDVMKTVTLEQRETQF